MFAPRNSFLVDEQIVESPSESSVAYRLLAEGSAFVVERRVLDRQSVSHVLFLTARNFAELKEMLLQDETFGDNSGFRLDRIFRAAMPLAAPTPVPLPDDPFELLGLVTPGASQLAVVDALKALGALCGLPNFLAVWLRRHGVGGLISTRLLAGCDAAWARTMVRMRWCVTDPLVTHARVRNEIVGSWQLSRLSPGQIAAGRQASNHGFSSSVCIPAHEAGGQASLALIFGGSSQPDARSLERQFLPLLQTASLRLLTWARERRWREEHGSIELTETQRRILSLLAQGDNTTTDIAELIGEPEGRIQYHVKRLRELFHAKSGVEVALKAVEAGLIDPLDPL